MKSQILKRFNAMNTGILFGIMLLCSTSFSVANAQNNLNNSGAAAQELLKFINDPQNRNDLLNNAQYQNDTELLMFVMKSIEDKNIKDINKKIEFVNSSNVSNDIKKQAISLINQNITYSDHEKVSYGIYMLKKCNVSPSANTCWTDYGPHQGCVPERSNICCN